MRRIDKDGEGKATAVRTVRIERLLPGPVSRIWTYLTDSDKRGQWLARGPMEPWPGGRVEHLFRHHELSHEAAPAAYAGMADSPAMAGEVTQWDPPRLLAYRWPGDGGASEVTFELFPEGSNVVLVVTHRHLADRGTMVSVAAGWDAHIGILIDTLNAVSPRGFWSTHERLAAHYDRTLPADGAQMKDMHVTETKPHIRVVRRFDASPERVFDAWLDPGTAAKWLFRSESGEPVSVEIDARVGGRFKVVARRADGDIRHVGEYLAIERPTMLMFTFAVPQFSPEYDLVTVEIRRLERGCELTLTNEMSPEIFAEWGERTKDGWAQILSGLAEAVDEAKGRSRA